MWDLHDACTALAVLQRYCFSLIRALITCSVVFYTYYVPTLFRSVVLLAHHIYLTPCIPTLPILRKEIEASRRNRHNQPTAGCHKLVLRNLTLH